MKVLLLPIGRDLTTQCKALREIGVEATSCHYRKEELLFRADICLHLERCSGRERKKRKLEFLKAAIQEFDVFHFHYATTFRPDFSDLVYLLDHGKKIVMQHLGSDVRRLSIARRFNNPYVRVNDGRGRTEEAIHTKLQQLAAHIEHVIVADYELLPYVQSFYRHTHVIPHIVNTIQYKPRYPSKHNRKPFIVHAPTNPFLKGSEYVQQAMNQIEQLGINASFQLIEKKPHTKAMRLYKKADIIVDQLLIGAIGVLSLEGMALGKPVICYIRDDLLKTYPAQLPIINAHPGNIVSKLKDLILQPDLRIQLGMQGRIYVEKHHHPHYIARRLLSLYQSIR